MTESTTTSLLTGLKIYFLVKMSNEKHVTYIYTFYFYQFCPYVCKVYTMSSVSNK